MRCSPERRHHIQITLGSLVIGMNSNLSPAQAQAPGPTRTIRLVNPFVPGGTSDIVSRAVASELSKQLGVQVIVDNKGGGGGVPAMQDVAKSAPDGYTIIIAHVANLAVNPYLFEKTGYDARCALALGFAHEARRSAADLPGCIVLEFTDEKIQK